MIAFEMKYVLRLSLNKIVFGEHERRKQIRFYPHFCFQSLLNFHLFSMLLLYFRLFTNG